MTTTTDSLANVPHPVGAVHVADWDGVQFGIEHTGRYFHGSVRVVERDGDNEDDISVEIYGSQGAAGDVTRLIAIDEGERAHPPEQPDPRSGVRPRAHCRGRRGRADGRLRPDHLTSDSPESARHPLGWRADCRFGFVELGQAPTRVRVRKASSCIRRTCPLGRPSTPVRRIVAGRPLSVLSGLPARIGNLLSSGGRRSSSRSGERLAAYDCRPPPPRNLIGGQTVTDSHTPGCRPRQHGTNPGGRAALPSTLPTSGHRQPGLGHSSQRCASARRRTLQAGARTKEGHLGPRPAPPPPVPWWRAAFMPTDVRLIHPYPTHTIEGHLT
jgi:hypothetical protein